MRPNIPRTQPSASVRLSKRPLRLVQLRERSNPGDAVRSRNQTDLGNAERLIDRHGCDLLYCGPWKKWLAWDGRRWCIDDCNAVMGRASKTARSIYGEVGQQSDPEQRKALSKFAAR